MPMISTPTDYFPSSDNLLKVKQLLDTAIKTGLGAAIIDGGELIAITLYRKDTVETQRDGSRS